jgi:iron complex transport system ATP-binding protein
MLEIKGLTFGYNGRSVLTDIGFCLNQGEIIAVAGPNGTGKSSLLKCITRINDIGKGQITIHGKDTRTMSRMHLARHLGYVPQSVQNRFPMTVFDAVLMGRRPHMGWRPSRRDMDIVSEILTDLNLADLAVTDFERLSGGQKQKVLLARALAQNADFLILDEPTSSLDLKHQIDVMELIRNLAVTRNVGVIMAMHDLNLAARFSDRVLMLHHGKVHGFGKPWDVIHQDSIRSVYGVDAMIGESNGVRFVLPEALKK